MTELTENETHVLEILYRWWRLHKQSIITVPDLTRRLVSDGFAADLVTPVDRLASKGWVTRSRPDIVMLTEAGIAEGLRRNL